MNSILEGCLIDDPARRDAVYQIDHAGQKLERRKILDDWCADKVDKYVVWLIGLLFRKRMLAGKSISDFDRTRMK